MLYDLTMINHSPKPEPEAKLEPTIWDQLVEETDKLLTDPIFDDLMNDPIFDEVFGPNSKL